MKNTLAAFVFFIAFIFMSYGCGSRETYYVIPATYSSIQSNIITPKCVKCHDEFSTYQGLKENLSAGNPDKSRIYREIKDDDMPEQSAPLSSDEKSAIYNWIKDGAKND